MKIGDKIRVRPITVGAPDPGESGVRTGKVVYIHPMNRFAVLEFKAKFGNGTFLESFHIGGSYE